MIKRAKLISRKKLSTRLVYGDVLNAFATRGRFCANKSFLAGRYGQSSAHPQCAALERTGWIVSGRWRYMDAGFYLDRTHLRFFTLDSIRELFAQAGLYINEIIPQVSLGKIPDQVRFKNHYCL